VDNESKPKQSSEMLGNFEQKIADEKKRSKEGYFSISSRRVIVTLLSVEIF